VKAVMTIVITHYGNTSKRCTSMSRRQRRKHLLGTVWLMIPHSQHQSKPCQPRPSHLHHRLSPWPTPGQLREPHDECGGGGEAPPHRGAQEQGRGLPPPFRAWRPKIKRVRVRPDRPDRQSARSVQASIAALCPAAGQQAACSCSTPPIIPSCPAKERAQLAVLDTQPYARSRTR
jgi:hypothetical protein